MREAVVGLDVGTSAMKGVLYALDGAELFATQQSYRLATPRPGWVELDAEALWQAAVTVLRTIAAATPKDIHIAGLALAAQAGSTVPVDSHGKPLAAMITWLDRRADELVSIWQADGMAEDIRRRSGWHPHAGLSIASIAWLVHNAPNVAARAHRFLDAQDYLLLRLTGRAVTDRSAGGVTALVDQATGAWSEELCDLAGIRLAHLPELTLAGTAAGPLLPEVRQATGLPADTRVVVGGHDQSCAALGMGVAAAGEVMLAAGTAWVITALTDAVAVAQIPEQMDLNFHVAPAMRTVSRLLGGFGATVEWWLNVVWGSEGETPEMSRAARYAALDRTLRASQPGAHDLLFLPLGGSPQVAPRQGLGGFVGLRLDHTRADMARAILEGVAFEVRWALDALAEAGLGAERMWLSGGAARSPVWPAILADVTGRPLLVAAAAGWPARGAALLAAAGVGLGGRMGRAAVLWRESLRRIEPDLGLAILYDDRYRRYRDMVDRLRPP
jgi:sugar (pentulose or hexulose) kinase